MSVHEEDHDPEDEDYPESDQERALREADERAEEASQAAYRDGLAMGYFDLDGDHLASEEPDWGA